MGDSVLLLRLIGTDHFLVSVRALLYSGDILSIIEYCFGVILTFGRVADSVERSALGEREQSSSSLIAAAIPAIRAEQSDRKWFLAAASDGLSFSSGLQS